MDNVKTGEFIKKLRKEQNLTQKELADKLHITDRAVSKWERGLSAPDIALLQPLAAALGVSVSELLEGERSAEPEQTQRIEARTNDVIDYSQKEIREKLRTARKKYLGLIAAGLALILVTGGLLLWQSGRLITLERGVSPDGACAVTVSSKDLGALGSSGQYDFTLVVRRPDRESEQRTTYCDCRYLGLWWAPDSSKFVLAFEQDGRVYYALTDLERGNEGNLNPVLPMDEAVTEYEFLRWAKDSANMLFYYSAADETGAPGEGYFWYNYGTGIADVRLELKP